MPCSTVSSLSISTRSSAYFTVWMICPPMLKSPSPSRASLVRHSLYMLNIYRVSHELRSLLRKSVPYVKIYRCNPKHVCPKLNGYGDNGQRIVSTSCISAYCTSSAVSALTLTEQCSRHFCECTSSAQRDKIAFHYCTCKVLGNPKDNYDVSASVFVVQFNGFMSLTS